jgi:hypothetical protein
MTETWAFGQTLPRSRSFWQFFEDTRKDEIPFFISSLKPFGLAHMLSQTFPLRILTYFLRCLVEDQTEKPVRGDKLGTHLVQAPPYGVML